MKKIFLIAVSLLLTFTMTACSTNSAEKSKTKDKSSENEIGKTVKTSNLLKIKVKQVKSNFSQSDEKNKVLLEVAMSIKNEDSVKSGAGAEDFQVKADNGKTYKVYGLDSRNFGAPIEPGKILTGSGYYEIPAKTKHVTLFYAPKDGKKMAQWKLTVPEK